MLKYATLTSMALLLSATAAYADGKDGMLSEKDAPIYHATRTVGPGLYVGATVGYGWGTSRTTFNNCNDKNNCGFYPDGDHPWTNNDPSGAIGGVTIGYNWRYTDKWLLGLEGDMSLADIKGQDGKYWGDGHRWNSGWGGLLTLRGRAGYDVGGNLVYGTAGIAAVNSDEYNIGDQTGDDDQGSNNTGWRWGWVAGVGVERQFSERVSGKIEYLHVEMSDNEGHGVKNDGRSTYVYQNDLDLIRVGLNYKIH